MNHLVLLVIAAILMLPGIVGIFVPIVPGVPLMFIAALLYGSLDRFQHLTSRELMFLAILALASFLIDHLSGLAGARFGGASKKSLWYGLIGTIVGLLVLPPFGSIIGLFIGVSVGELMQGRSRERAAKAATTSVLGSLAGMAINAILGVTFLILFIVFSVA